MVTKVWVILIGPPTPSSLFSTNRRRERSRSKGWATRALSEEKGLTEYGPTCQRSSGQHGTESMGENTSPPSQTSEENPSRSILAAQTRLPRSGRSRYLSPSYSTFSRMELVQKMFVLRSD